MKKQLFLLRDQFILHSFLLVFSLNASEASILKSRTLSLHEKIAEGDVAGAKLLIDDETSVNTFNENGQAPLHLAVALKNIKIMNLLLDAGAWINICERKKRTALHIAAENNFIDGIMLLIKRCANSLAKDIKGYTPLHVAAKKGFVECIDALLDRSGHFASDNEDYSPLHIAVRSTGFGPTSVTITTARILAAVASSSMVLLSTQSVNLSGIVLPTLY